MSKPSVPFLILALAVSFLAVNESVDAKNLYGSVKKTAQKTPPSLMTEAIQKYATGKYKESAQRLEYIDGHGGCCDKVHYFLGLDYQNLNQTVLAQMHYQWVMSYSKNARLRQYADVANDQLAYYQAHRSYSGQGMTASGSFG